MDVMDKSRSVTFKDSKACKVLFYCLIFLLSLLIFDSFAIIFAVLLALLAFNLIRSRFNRDQ